MERKVGKVAIEMRRVTSSSIHSFTDFLEFCPTGYAYVDKAHGMNTGHQLAECSNRGLCDRDSVSKTYQLRMIGSLGKLHM
jgi:hypothetical protein